jgi:hypothetical protein
MRGSGEAVKVLFNATVPNAANRKSVTGLIWNRDNPPKIYGLPVIDIREVTIANEGMLARAVPPGHGCNKN